MPLPSPSPMPSHSLSPSPSALTLSLAFTISLALTLSLALGRTPPAARPQIAFSTLDPDNSGSLDAHELGAALELFGQPTGPDQIEKLIAIVDADGSGSVEFAEFATLMSKQLLSALTGLRWERVEESPDARRRALMGMVLELNVEQATLSA